MAKSIVAKTCKVFVPRIPKTEYDFSNHGSIEMFDKAVIEKQLSDSVRGDIVLYRNEKFLNVEIKVTHEVDVHKTIELFNLDIPTIEIDLSDIKFSFNPEMVERSILSRERVRLITSPKCKEIFR